MATLPKDDLANYKAYVKQCITKGLLPEILDTLQFRIIYQLFVSRKNQTYTGAVLCYGPEGKDISYCIIVDEKWFAPTLVHVTANQSFTSALYKELAKTRDVAVFDSFSYLNGVWQQGLKGASVILNHLVSVEQARAL